MIYDIAVAWNWPPQWVGALTLYQFRIYCSKEEDLGGKKKMSGKEYQEYRARKSNPWVGK